MIIDKQRGQIRLSQRETDSWLNPTPNFDMRAICVTLALRVLNNSGFNPDKSKTLIVVASPLRGARVLDAITLTDTIGD